MTILTFLPFPRGLSLSLCALHSVSEARRVPSLLVRSPSGSSHLTLRKLRRDSPSTQLFYFSWR
ncbi:hypothetical protein CRG98_038555, partial [Punica granatum]